MRPSPYSTETSIDFNKNFPKIDENSSSANGNVLVKGSIDEKLGKHSKGINFHKQISIRGKQMNLFGIKLIKIGKSIHKDNADYSQQTNIINQLDNDQAIRKHSIEIDSISSLSFQNKNNLSLSRGDSEIAKPSEKQRQNIYIQKSRLPSTNSSRMGNRNKKLVVWLPTAESKSSEAFFGNENETKRKNISCVFQQNILKKTILDPFTQEKNFEKNNTQIGNEEIYNYNVRSKIRKTIIKKSRKDEISGVKLSLSFLYA
jgi:hypothetical protein